jgi:hypothetical protein
MSYVVLKLKTHHNHPQRTHAVKHDVCMWEGTLNDLHF